MATPFMAKIPGKPDGDSRSSRDRRTAAALRLLDSERSEEIFPILLEEILALGFPRAFVLAVDYETGEITPVASLRCGRKYLDRFRTSLYASGNELVERLMGQQPAVLDNIGGVEKLYSQPAIFRGRNVCWEAERDHLSDCLAFSNNSGRRDLRLEDQVCGACAMRGYAALVCVELTPAKVADVNKLRDLIEISNRHMTRLFKVEHYYNRMTDMELTIAQMETMMQSMTDPVILTDTHYRVITAEQSGGTVLQTSGRSRRK